MYRLTVLYGHPADPPGFQKYYREVQIPLARTMKGLKGWTIGMCESAVPGEKPPYYMIVGLYADSREDMQAILDSPEGQATVADVPKFATGGVTFLHDREEVLNENEACFLQLNLISFLLRIRLSYAIFILRTSTV